MRSRLHCWGDYFGYPKCCIRAFHRMLVNKKEFKTISQERQATTQNGFVPCQRCAERILKGEIKIHELIQPTRQAPKPFSHCV